MAVSDLTLFVEIDQETYRLDIVPPIESRIVALEKERLLGAIDLKTLVGDLERVGTFIRIAYNNVRAAGPKFTKLQIEIRRIGYDVTKLCNQSALTASELKKGSKVVLDDLQAMISEYLLHNLAELAIETWPDASNMERAAMELHHEFRRGYEQENTVVGALTNTEADKEFLHNAFGALKELFRVLMLAAQFWIQLQYYCKWLAEDQVKNTVEKAMKYSDKKRLKMWTSKGFKFKAVQSYAGWVALNSVCTVYVEHIKLTQKDLYQYLRENPTYEQSRENVKVLAEKFLTDQYLTKHRSR